MSNHFTSFQTAATAVLEMTRLLADHAAAREAAALTNHAAADGGVSESLPGLTPEDVKRLGRIAALAQGPYAERLAPLIVEAFPMLVAPEATA